MPKGYKIEKITDPIQEIGLMTRKIPELIFIDLAITDVDAYALCNFLRKSTAYKETPIIIYSGQDSWINRAKAKLAGATDFLRKPATSNKILQIVEKYLRVQAKQDQSKSNLIMSKSLVLAR